MKRNWTEEELITDFILMPDELNLLMGNRKEANRLGFALLLKYFQQEAKFPTTKQDIPRVIIEGSGAKTSKYLQVISQTWTN